MDALGSAQSLTYRSALYMVTVISSDATVATQRYPYWSALMSNFCMCDIPLYTFYL